tara:strand:+ start:7900 stop:8352 length:453 start_codon:yes stop_codon:yes gene_type:complete
MRYLIADVADGNVADRIYEDPPAEPGTVETALANTLISTLDLAPMPEAEADRLLESGPRCRFNRSPETDPVLWIDQGTGTASMKLNGVLVPLEAEGATDAEATRFLAPGATVTVRRLGDEADWRADAALEFELDQGLSVGYRGFYRCEPA